MPASSKYNPEYHDDWAWSLAMKGATDDDIAEAFGISVRTLHRWKQEHESFLIALTTGKEVSDAKVEKSLYQRALGYQVKDVEQIIDTDPATGQRTVSKQRILTKNVAPDTMAIMYWLNNRKKNTGEWSQAQKVELSGSLANVDLSNLSDDDLKAIAEYAAAQDAAKDGKEE